MNTTTLLVIAYQPELLAILLIIFFAGIIGGLANFYRDDTNQKFNRFKFIKSILLGLVASSTIPLFLQMISSDLLIKDTIPLFNYLVFGGFCILAAVFSADFLDSLGKRILEKVNQAQETAEEAKDQAEAAKANAEEAHDKTDALIDLNAEPAEASTDDENGLESMGLESMPKAPPTEIRKVVLAFKSSNYPFRTLEGIVKDTGLDTGEVKKRIKKLISEGVMQKIEKKDGTKLYSLTAKGKAGK